MRWVKGGTGETVHAARTFLGYRANAARDASFNRAYQGGKYGGSTWSGLFVDRVLHMCNLTEVSFASTVTALAYYVRQNRLYMQPRPGDIVFYAFPPNPLYPFEQPHVGVVTEVLNRHEFRAIEGETATGLPKGSQEIDTVSERLRYRHEVIGFVRPRAPKPTRTADKTATVRMSQFENGANRPRAITAMQRALHYVTGLTAPHPGRYDHFTRSLLARFDREHGTPNSTGEITETVLRKLAENTDAISVLG